MKKKEIGVNIKEDIDFDCCTFTDIIKFIEEIRNRHPECSEFIVWQSAGYNNICTEIEGRRLETTEEYEKRKVKEENAKVVKKKQAEQLRDKELKELERLQKKYGKENK